MRELMDALGYHFHHERLLRQALTHPSCGGQDNQRLEFLGDAVLQLVMSDRLFRAHAQMDEGKLTHLRAQLVCEATLADVARHIGLGERLRMDKSAQQGGGRERASILSDAMEAVLAAVYLDGGLAAAMGVVGRLWPGEAARPETDAKSALQEYLQSRGGETPTYHTIAEEGPAHLRSFTVEVRTAGRALGTGTGASKKKAEQQAAQRALCALARSGEA